MTRAAAGRVSTPATRVATERGEIVGRHGGFVEIDGAELIGSAHASATVLELADPRGAKLTARLPDMTHMLS